MYGTAQMRIPKNKHMQQVPKEQNQNTPRPKLFFTGFDELRKNRVKMSFYKYGPAEENYGKGYSKAIPSLEKCLEKYKMTGNTEYLCDLANYAMFEFMFPQHPKAHFRATRSEESAGIVGLPINEMNRFKEEAKRGKL